MVPHDSDPEETLPLSPSDDEPLSTEHSLRESTEQHQHPSRIGPYQIKEVLGQGGMGVVYLAEQVEPIKREVALKLIRVNRDTREVVTRFESERQSLALMDHENIARVLDAGETESRSPYFVMEYVRGEPIAAWCDRKRSSVRQRLQLFIVVCSAIEHAHQKAIIHRDIKPSNVLVAVVNGSPTPKVIDFGIAKALGDRSDMPQLTGDGQILGTLQYMSPEQANSGGSDVDVRSDVYALGALLYELLTGEPALRLPEANFVAAIQMIRETEPEKPSTAVRRRTTEGDGLDRVSDDSLPLPVELKGDLDAIVLKALAKEPSCRYPSASEFAADIRRLLKHRPVLAREGGRRYKASRFLRRHRKAVAAWMVLLAILLVVWAGLVFKEWRRYSHLITEVRGAAASREVKAAREYLALLNERYAGKDEVRALDDRIQELERELLIERGEALGRSAASAAEEFGQANRRLSELEGKLAELRKSRSKWELPWERPAETEAEVEARRLRLQLETLFSRATLQWETAINIVPSDSSTHREFREDLEKFSMERYRETESTGGLTLSREYFRSRIAALDLGTYKDELAGRCELTLAVNPPDADVYCFRYDETELRLVPRPYDPTRGLDSLEGGFVGKPFLRVEKVWFPETCEFRRGDVLLEVRGFPVSGYGDLAAAVEDVSPGQTVPVRVRREDVTRVLDWTPWASERVEPGRVLPFFDSLGVTFEPCPLVFNRDCELSPTGAGEFRIRLPAGSYLFVARKSGFQDCRLPLVTPGDHVADARHLLRLIPRKDIPPGFVYVPAGTFRRGGVGERSYQSMPVETTTCDGFFLSRYEVTFGEFGDFLNRSEIGRRLDDQGSLPRAELSAKAWSDSALAEFLPAANSAVKRITLIPVYTTGGRATPLFSKQNGEWKRHPRIQAEHPLYGTNFVAAVEFAHWTTEEDSRWRYRLPSQKEWERAARGADGRAHVWGNELILGYCKSYYGTKQDNRYFGRAAPGGAYPIDESVFGIRDLNGSASEPTTSRFEMGDRLFVICGGSRDCTADVDFYLATRNRMRPASPHSYLGIRLAADLPVR